MGTLSLTVTSPPPPPPLQPPPPSPPPWTSASSSSSCSASASWSPRSAEAVDTTRQPTCAATTVLCARWAASAEPSTCASVPAGSGADSHSSSSSDSASATAGTSALRDYIVNVQIYCGF